ncbi:hypothetical protein ACXDF8_15410 [Mycolicibacterium sp. CBM1]
MLSELHFIWNAEPGIDVAARPAVIVRAYQESVSAASFGGSDDYLYPGFTRAVAPNQPVGSPRSTLALWPETRYPLSRPQVGTFRYHILSIEKRNLDVTAVVCAWLWGSARQQPDGSYKSVNRYSDGAGVVVERFDLRSPSGSGADNIRPQTGPSPYATNDVFGEWRVVGALSASDSNGAGPQWPEFDQDHAACAAKAPESEERRQFLTSGEHPRSDFPTLPAYPGWPAETQ